MQNIGTLLLKLSKNVLKTDETNQLKLIKMLLTQTIDSNYFIQVKMEKIITFSGLNNLLSDYYKNELHQQIKDTFLFSAQFKDKFIQTYKLILDLALIKDVQDYWAQILAMDNDQQNILSSFVQQITNRQQFINLNSQSEQSVSKSQKSSYLIEQKDEQIMILKEEYEELQKKYIELEDNYNTMKSKHDKMNTQLNTIKQEKLYLLQDLGLHQNCTYEEVNQKYKKQINEFNKQIQRLNKQIQDKNQINLQRETYNRELIDLHERQTQKQKLQHAQMIQQQQKIALNLKKQMDQLTQKRDQDAFQIQNLKQYLMQYKKKCEQAQKKLIQQQVFVDKFFKMKKLHVQFRKQVMAGNIIPPSINS